MNPQERARRAVEAAWRIEWPRLVASLTRMVGDIATAEELAQDALVAALEQWPRDGVPPNPGGWLMLTAKHRAVDRIRRDVNFARKLEQLGRLAITAEEPSGEPEPAIADDLLRMIFTACHPVLSPPARAALTLRMVGGLTTTEVARAYLVPESTVAQRIVRAKRTITAKGIPYEVPEGTELTARLDSVLEVIYLIFNEGYAATSGERWVRAELCEEALRLARILTGLLPGEPEVHGLAALLELQASRTPARSDAENGLVLLPDQDRSRWNRLSIGRGLAALARAHTLNRTRDLPPGRYALQAAIASVHAVARTAADTDWRRIAGLYAVLAQRFPSPIVELNRAVAVAMVHGPAAGLELIDAIAATGTLDDYHLLHAVRGDLLSRLGREAEARAAFGRAAELCGNEIERELLRGRTR
ncbi:RNA polymerase sigma factor [Nocardia aurantiaca]|uniref:Sigma-70 family RNA polymerase sigma factor n=1 Tax=Nocardia aurantiaca TaxID=2675850 RepID=A0A6I3L9W7_9NOCA|nr:RNA polymerase sigma factor [Nocardia aurantiaca]MTE16639.1 sigma-70 family RNA polymerase sigma factor [Nocardia aurantiaca]